ncbi:MAG: TIGR00725 family protein [Deltaproteobacteria bacterium]|nr:TIGR00725 family protein [Deltaproteobacteria bacterium]
MENNIQIGVIGAGKCSDRIYDLAASVGYEIGKRGWTLICGGLAGVMEASARGCLKAGGMTVGILPGTDKNTANPYIKVALPTGLGDGRNLLVARAADLLIAIAGGYGTLSEIALALKMGKVVPGIHTWENIEGIRYVETPDDAIKEVRLWLNGV